MLATFLTKIPNLHPVHPENPVHPVDSSLLRNCGPRLTSLRATLKESNGKANMALLEALPRF